ncbi:MAG: phosphomannomutase/phosphoglucomutase [bacterium]|nr:phosphomannomutase/phosphoglucomutase [bacterium]
MLYSRKIPEVYRLVGNNINERIFREYDVRGTVGDDLNAETVTLIARAIGTYLVGEKKDTVVLCRDNRPSSDEFRAIMLDVLSGSGLKVLDIGMFPTPLFYFACERYTSSQGGVMITGSHNPPQYNGFKIVCGKGTIYGDKVRELYEIIQRKDFAIGDGSIEELNAKDEYVTACLERADVKRPVKVIADAGNGTAATLMPDILRQAGADAEGLFCEVDGSFPNHFPDPTVPENLADLQKRVVETGAEVGIAFDGDADRIGAVDDKGRIIYGDRLLALYARQVLAENPGGKVIFEVKCSQALQEEIERLGGVPIMWKTGHSLIEAKIHEESAKLAGEMSGHIYFADRWFGFDDAIYSALRLVELLSKSENSLSEMLDEMPQYHSTPEIRFDCPDDVKFGVVEKVKAYFEEKYDVIGVDGARILFGDGWGLVRASNTQAVLVMRFEAKSEERLAEIRAEVEEVVARFTG